MSDPVRENEIAARMLGRLREQFKDKPKLEAFIRALANQCQHVEQMLWDLYTRRWIDDAEDADLDNLGAIVGEPRNGSEDDAYRQYIRARIKVNRSDGQIGQLLEIMVLLLGTANPIQVRELYPAALEVEATEAITLDGEYLNRWFMQLAKAAGVNLHTIASHEPRATSLIFDWTDERTTVAQRPGSSTGTTGGLTAALYGAN
jgi:hypothetical protein